MDLVLVDPETGASLVGLGVEGVTITDLVRGDSRRIHSRVPVVSDWLPEHGPILLSIYGEGTGTNLFQIDPDGSGGPTPLVQSPKSKFYATVSPDQTRMMYYTTQSIQRQVEICGSSMLR